MEKVVLLIEHTGAHLRCLLNPEQLEVRRSAGVVTRRSLGDALSGAGLSDDPLLYVGGGRTELTLDLLFDVALAVQGPDAPPLSDVRILTGPIWDLAENDAGANRYGRPPILRLLWGTSWNVPGIVTAVAERLEQFTAQGQPRRSWLRLRLLRVGYATRDQGTDPTSPPLAMDEARRRIANGRRIVHEPISGGERLDQIAADYCGHTAYWSLLAELNGLDDPLGTLERPLQVPADFTIGTGGGHA